MNGTGIKVAKGSKFSPVIPLKRKKGIKPTKTATGQATKYTFNDARMVASANKSQP